MEGKSSKVWRANVFYTDPSGGVIEELDLMTRYGRLDDKERSDLETGLVYGPLQCICR